MTLRARIAAFGSPFADTVPGADASPGSSGTPPGQTTAPGQTGTPVTPGQTAEQAALERRYAELASYLTTVEEDFTRTPYLLNVLGSDARIVRDLLIAARDRLDHVPPQDPAIFLQQITQILDGADARMNTILAQLDYWDRNGSLPGRNLMGVIAAGVLAAGFIVWSTRKYGDGIQGFLLASGEYELRDIEDCGCDGGPE